VDLVVIQLLKSIQPELEASAAEARRSWAPWRSSCSDLRPGRRTKCALAAALRLGCQWR
jgi:hypothetical protein